jgi:hypothetical protein
VADSWLTSPRFIIKNGRPAAYPSKGAIVSRVYLSYDRRDAGFARRLSQVLEQRGMKVWRDPMNLAPGGNWDGEIERAMRQSDVYLACWSRNAVESDWVEREAFHAHLLGRLICLRIDGSLDLDELPRFCRGYAMQDLYPRALRGSADPYERLVGAIKGVAGRKITLEDRDLASEPQALANSRRGLELLPGLLKDRERNSARESRYGNALRDLSRSAWSHVRFGVERFITTNPGDSGEACLAPLHTAVEESNDASVWTLYGDVLSPFEPLAAYSAYRRAGLPPDYVESLIPDRDRREAFADSPSGRSRSGARAALATAAALLVLAGAGVVGVTQLGGARSGDAIQISSAVVSSTASEPAATVQRAEPEPAPVAEAPQPKWAEVQPQGGPSADVRSAGRTGDLPSLPPPPPPPEPVAALPAPEPAPAPASVAEVTPPSASELRPLPPTLPISRVMRLCRAGPLAPGERIETVLEDESIGKFALRVSQGGADQIYERNRACLDDEARQISRPDGSIIAGRDLLFPRDVLIIPAGLPGPGWMATAPNEGTAEPATAVSPTPATP